MDFFKEYLPVIITFLTTYSGIAVFLVKFKDLGIIKELKSKVENLSKRLKEQTKQNEEMKKILEKIERQQRGVYEDEE